jgi:hypothetical protein
MNLNNILEPTRPVSGSINRATGFFTNLVDKGIEYKILREENKLALAQREPENDKTSSQERSVKPDLGSGAIKAVEVSNPIVTRQSNAFLTYGVPTIAILSGLIAIYAVAFRKGGKR